MSMNAAGERPRSSQDVATASKEAWGGEREGRGRGRGEREISPLGSVRCAPLRQYPGAPGGERKVGHTVRTKGSARASRAQRERGREKKGEREIERETERERKRE